MATRNITLEEANGHLSELVHQIKPGDEIVLTEGNEPTARIIPIVKRKGKRVFGQYRGKMKMKDNFDAPLPDEFWFGD